MGHKPHHDEWDIIPFDNTQPSTDVAEKSSLFLRVGNRLGNLFISAKKRATSKYREVTSGINQKLDEEYEHLRAEFAADLFAQTAEFECTLKQQKRRWIGISLMTTLIGFFIGMVTTINII